MNKDFIEALAEREAQKAIEKKRKSLNPHNFPRFETDGFVTYSINQEAHDAKYAKYLKKKNKL